MAIEVGLLKVEGTEGCEATPIILSILSILPLISDIISLIMSSMLFPVLTSSSPVVTCTNPGVVGDVIVYYPVYSCLLGTCDSYVESITMYNDHKSRRSKE